MKKEHVLNRTRYQDLFLCKQCDEKMHRTCEICLQVRNETLSGIVQAEGRRGTHRATGESQCRY